MVWSSPCFTLFCGLIQSVFHFISWSDPVLTRFTLKCSVGLMFFYTAFTWNYSVGFESVKTGVVFPSHPFHLTHSFHSLCCISCLLHTHLGLTPSDPSENCWISDSLSVMTKVGPICPRPSEQDLLPAAPIQTPSGSESNFCFTFAGKTSIIWPSGRVVL